MAYAVANITVFGILALLAYPYLAHLMFDGNIVMAGLFQGTAIHETAQVTGAALIYGQTYGAAVKPNAADFAIVTKPVRNVFIAFVVPLAAWVYARRALGAKPFCVVLFTSLLVGVASAATVCLLGRYVSF